MEDKSKQNIENSPAGINNTNSATNSNQTMPTPILKKSSATALPEFLQNDTPFKEKRKKERESRKEKEEAEERAYRERVAARRARINYLKEKNSSPSPHKASPSVSLTAGGGGGDDQQSMTGYGGVDGDYHEEQIQQASSPVQLVSMRRMKGRQNSPAMRSSPLVSSGNIAVEQGEEEKEKEKKDNDEGDAKLFAKPKPPVTKKADSNNSNNDSEVPEGIKSGRVTPTPTFANVRRLVEHLSTPSGSAFTRPQAVSRAEEEGEEPREKNEKQPNEEVLNKKEVGNEKEKDAEKLKEVAEVSVASSSIGSANVVKQSRTMHMLARKLSITSDDGRNLSADAPVTPHNALKGEDEAAKSEKVVQSKPEVIVGETTPSCVKVPKISVSALAKRFHQSTNDQEGGSSRTQTPKPSFAPKTFKKSTSFPIVVPTPAKNVTATEPLRETESGSSATRSYSLQETGSGVSSDSVKNEKISPISASKGVPKVGDLIKSFQSNFTSDDASSQQKRPIPTPRKLEDSKSGLYVCPSKVASGASESEAVGDGTSSERCKSSETSIDVVVDSSGEDGGQEATAKRKDISVEEGNVKSDCPGEKVCTFQETREQKHSPIKECSVDENEDSANRNIAREEHDSTGSAILGGVNLSPTNSISKGSESTFAAIGTISGKERRASKESRRSSEELVKKAESSPPTVTGSNTSAFFDKRAHSNYELSTPTKSGIVNGCESDEQVRGSERLNRSYVSISSVRNRDTLNMDGSKRSPEKISELIESEELVKSGAKSLVSMYGEKSIAGKHALMELKQCDQRLECLHQELNESVIESREKDEDEASSVKPKPKSRTTAQIHHRPVRIPLGQVFETVKIKQEKAQKDKLLARSNSSKACNYVPCGGQILIKEIAIPKCTGFSDIDSTSKKGVKYMDQFYCIVKDANKSIRTEFIDDDEDCNTLMFKDRFIFDVQHNFGIKIEVLRKRSKRREIKSSKLRSLKKIASFSDSGSTKDIESEVHLLGEYTLTLGDFSRYTPSICEHFSMDKDPENIIPNSVHSKLKSTSFKSKCIQGSMSLKAFLRLDRPSQVIKEGFCNVQPQLDVVTPWTQVYYQVSGFKISCWQDVKRKGSLVDRSLVIDLLDCDNESVRALSRTECFQPNAMVLAMQGSGPIYHISTTNKLELHELLDNIYKILMDINLWKKE
eukprot:Nk52_evm15s355 gene=Nk52_evmTU15s355